MRELLVMIAADLRQRLRDRTVLIFGLLAPLALMLVFNAIIGDSSIDMELEPVSVVASVPEDDQFSAIVLDALRSIEVLDVSVEEASPDGVQLAVEGTEAELGIVVPDGFTAAVESGEGTAVRIIEGDGSGLETNIAIEVVTATVDQLHATALTFRAGVAAGLSSDQLAEVASQGAAGGPALTLSEGAASDEQLSPSGLLVAGQAGLFLLFTVGFGVLALLAEREQGTLARLQSMPMRRELIVAAKVLSGYVLGVISTTVLLLAGSWLFDVDFGNPLAVGVLVLAAVAAATSLTFVVARVARTAEQANVSQSIVALVLGIAGGAFFPLSARGAVAQLLDLNPVAALQRGLGITSGGGGLADITTPVTVMLGFAVVFILLSRVLPDRGAAA